MNFSEPVKCDVCHGTKLRGETFLVDTLKGRFRVCRECYATYGKGKLNEHYKTAKDNIGILKIKGVDAYELIKEQEKFIKNIKEGRLNGRP